MGTQGHSGEEANHNAAVMALVLHMVGAAVWLGGLLLLVVLPVAVGLASATFAVSPLAADTKPDEFVHVQKGTLPVIVSASHGGRKKVPDVPERVEKRTIADLAEWPYPRERLGEAVRRGYEHLPRSQKRLPLV
jgi:hypothetical protein